MSAVFIGFPLSPITRTHIPHRTPFIHIDREPYRRPRCPPIPPLRVPVCGIGLTAVSLYAAMTDDHEGQDVLGAVPSSCGESGIKGEV